MIIEDDFNDIIGKAIRGTGISTDQLAISSAQLSALISGEMNEDHVRTIAPLLGLDAEKLIQLEHYAPEVRTPANLHIFTSSFGHLGVNAFVLETENHFLIFDTGTDATKCLKFLAQDPSKESHLFITHDHADHIADLHRFKQTAIHETSALQNKAKQYDDYTVTGLDVAGHATPATAYLIESDTLSASICIVGDAIFAGSIGGCKTTSAYPIALSNIRDNILAHPANTILCPGHGPLTTVHLELENNPFL